MENTGNNTASAREKYTTLRSSAFMIRTAVRAKEKKVLVMVVLEALIAVGTSLVGLFVTPAILAVIEARGTMLELIATIVCFALPMMLLAALTEYLTQNRLYPRVTVRSYIISLLAEKRSRTSYQNLYDKRFSDMSWKAVEACFNNSEASEAIWQTFTSLLKNLLGFGIYLALLTAAEPLLLVFVLVLSLIGYFISRRLDDFGYKHREEQAAIDKKLEYQFNLTKKMGLAKDIRMFGMLPWIQEVTQKALGAKRAFAARAENVYIWGRVADMALALLRNGAAYWFLISQVLAGGMGVPAFLLYFTAVGGFTTWVTGILGDLNTLHRQGLDLAMIREVLDYPEPFKFNEGKPISVDPAAPHQITLRDVSYRYPGADKDTLSHIDLTIHPGEKLAVVGLNGAGKTTLVKLICGFLDPTGGVVELDGQDIRQYNREDYYKAFSVVFQDFSILAGSIALNITQQDGDDIDRARMLDCVEKAGLTEKIASLKDGLDTKLVRRVYLDGVELSGGETQRLMLARALYKPAAFVLLDEPTAALDPIAEADMYNKYNSMTDGRLSVYISHRLASTRFCDRIIFIDGGKIAEEGSHEELLQRGGGYARLFEVQSKYYREDFERGEVEHE